MAAAHLLQVGHHRRLDLKLLRQLLEQGHFLGFKFGFQKGQKSEQLHRFLPLPLVSDQI
jgi:hypothetical protein